MKPYPQQTRFICAILSVMATVLVIAFIIFFSVITGIHICLVRDLISTFFFLAVFYYIFRNINKILYE